MSPQPGARRALFIVGAGRSGTSTLAVLLQRLGMHVPQPEVRADDTNPRGFGEPRWMVDFHDRLLDEAMVTVGDSRPEAWFETGRIASREPDRRTAATWLEEHLAASGDLVIKDPRLGWFLGLWRAAAIRCRAAPAFATMLRPPAEVVGSRQHYYQNRLGSAHLAASWLNMQLHTERATRPGPGDGGRAFVRYADLLEDWVRVTRSVAERLQLGPVLDATDAQIRDAHRFLDPGLRRVSGSLADLSLPPRLHELVAESWSALDALAAPAGDTQETRRTLDQLREAYLELYEEAEAISRSSAVAAGTRARRASRASPTPFQEQVRRVRQRVPRALRRGQPRAGGGGGE